MNAIYKLQRQQNGEVALQLNEVSSPTPSMMPLILYVTNERSEVVARLVACSFRAVLRIESIWTAENTERLSLARTMLHALEVEAEKRNCRYFFADEPDCLLVDLYEELGYTKRELCLNMNTKVSGLAKEV